MKWINYTKYIGDDLGISAEDLMRALAEFFLQSGYENQYMQFSEMDEHSLERLKEAIERALREGDLFDKQMANEMAERFENMPPQEFNRLVDNLVQKLADEGYINADKNPEKGKSGKPRDVKFDITDKSVDFLGFKTLKDLLAGLGRASFGAHDTREMATGVETSGSSKSYEFGDTLNLDVCRTLFTADHQWIEPEGVTVHTPVLERQA